MKYEKKEQAAFIAASMITLADRSMTDLRALTELVGTDAVQELLIILASVRTQLRGDGGGNLCLYRLGTRLVSAIS